MTAEQAAVLQMQMQAIQPVLPTPEKRWYDRLADTILGDDPRELAFQICSTTGNEPSAHQLVLLLAPTVHVRYS